MWSGHRDWKLQDKDCVKFKQTSRLNILGENLIILFAQKHKSSILHEYLDYENL
ncbi:hypothetical protein HMPREF9261_0846 [Finegoldia magna ACS-171-V-Col3]|nr:hypothetical protein HMPREF9261_0846 [Finegoldia magna ACS-171-V-Col3]